MLTIALKMLMADRAKFTGLLFGIAFTSFLVTFAASYFSGFMTRGFSLISENRTADVWVMDPAVTSVEQTINIPDAALSEVKSVQGVQSAAPLALASADVRFPQGRFQTFQVIAVDDATLAGAPLPDGVQASELRGPNAVIVDAGGTSGKLQTALKKSDQWPHRGVRLDVPTRELTRGDALLLHDHLVQVIGRSETLPRYPPRPLMFTTLANAQRILHSERHMTTFIMVKAIAGVSTTELAARIAQQTGLRARTSSAFKNDTVRWYLINSEDVGDIAAMLILAMTIGFGVAGIMLYMFTFESLKQYAVLKAMGTTPRVLLRMITVQALVCALLGTGLGLGVCGIAGEIVVRLGYPFRMMWFTPLIGITGVVVVCLAAAVLSARPVLKLQPAVVFSGR